MTQRKIIYARNRIKAGKEQGFYLEALLKSYHLNVDLIKFLLCNSSENYSAKGKKIKVIVREFLHEIENNLTLKAILNKRNLKSVKPWLDEMDIFFKTLKLEYPANVKSLQSNSEKVFALLNISANKLFVQHKK
ncbi:MAG: hypothetical protein KF900_02185 [Bacteroidetes bacterium]|nr:hypothetical protein [Bacteroidota bacterium]